MLMFFFRIFGFIIRMCVGNGGSVGQDMLVNKYIIINKHRPDHHNQKNGGCFYCYIFHKAFHNGAKLVILM